MIDEDIVSQRMLKIEQRKNRLSQEQAMLKTKLRKMRTRRLIELGGLVSKAELEGWNTNALYGALLFVKEKEGDLQQVEQWTKKGAETFEKEKARGNLKDEVRILV